MAVLMSLGGNSAGDGFLLAPLGANYEAEIALWTDAGTTFVTVQADPAHNIAGLVFSTAAPISISTVPIIITVHATMQSVSRGDTIIQVLPSGGGAPLISFAVTSITFPVVNFKGRFEARFATDRAIPFRNTMYTAAVDTIPAPPGWTWGLEGEPGFVPTVGNVVPTDLEMTGLGRVIRLNSPVALRSPVSPNPGEVPDVVTKVDSITGETTSSTEKFTAGDPLIGQLVNFGPDTYFAGNANSLGNTGGFAQPEESWDAAFEPLGLFEIRIGASFSPPAIYFRGASKVGPPGSGTPGPNNHTRSPDSRPIADGLPDAMTEFAEFGLPDFVASFSDARIDVLLPLYNAAPDPSQARRNLKRRIGHLLGSASSAKVTSVGMTNPEINVRVGTLTLMAPSPPFPPNTLGWWRFKEVYKGTVDNDLHAWRGGPTGGSAVITYMTEFAGGFKFEWHAFGFHSDELCGYHKGSLITDMIFHGGHIGDPHTHTVNGTAYDFQAVGEFTLLRNGERMEVQVRQTPVATANPINDSYSGLAACVSINTAMAAQIGRHRISLQPGGEGPRLQFYLDGKPAQLPMEGIDLGSNRVSAFDANGETGLRIDYDDDTVVTATPAFWSAHKVWYMDVSVSNTRAYEGVMGFVPKNSWLPRLRNGTDLGPKPASLNDRYVALYKTFADSWRVTNKTSLFVYAPGTSTKTFTDQDWPADKPPCKLKSQFQIPGVGVHKGVPLAQAEMICRAVTDKELHNNCVFDVATTGDETFANGYRFAQELRLCGTAVRITGYLPAMVLPDRSGEGSAAEQPHSVNELLAVTATVSPLSSGRPIPTGTVTFFIDGLPMKRPMELDAQGNARVTIGPLKVGEHRIRATYSGGGKYGYHSSTSPNLLHTVAPRTKIKKPEPGPVKPNKKPHPVTANARRVRAKRRPTSSRDKLGGG